MALFKRPLAQHSTSAPLAASVVTDLDDLVRWLATHGVVAGEWWSPAVCYADAEGIWHSDWQCSGLRGEIVRTRRGVRLGELLQDRLCRCGWSRIAAATPLVASALALRGVATDVRNRPIPSDPGAIIAEVVELDRIRRGDGWPQAPLPELTPALGAVEDVCIRRVGDLRAMLTSTSDQLASACVEALHDPKAPFQVETLVAQFSDGAVLSTTAEWVADPFCARVVLTHQVPPSGTYTLAPCLLAAPAPVAAWAASRMLTAGWQVVKAEPGEDLHELVAAVNQHWSKDPHDNMHRLFRAVNRARSVDAIISHFRQRAHTTPQATSISEPGPGDDPASPSSASREDAPQDLAPQDVVPLAAPASPGTPSADAPFPEPSANISLTARTTRP